MSVCQRIEHVYGCRGDERRPTFGGGVLEGGRVGRRAAERWVTMLLAGSALFALYGFFFLLPVFLISLLIARCPLRL
jgi:hypothetical protein